MNYEEILHREVMPALGCTEPIAVAYAAAWARKTLGQPVERMEVNASRNILKNAMSVGIPGTDMAGLPIAAALGAIGGRTDVGLEVLGSITPEQAAQGMDMVRAGKIVVSQKQGVEALYIEVVVSGGGHSAEAIIRRTHTHVTDLLCDGTVIKHDELEELSAHGGESDPMTVHEIFQFCQTVPAEKLSFLREGIELNMAAAKEGLDGRYGLSVGHNIAATGASSNLMGSDIGTCAVATTAAACEARMAGAKVPVMSVAGSGNQGLVCTLPVVIFAQKCDVGQERLLRAVALSDLVTIHIRRGIGRLSPLCGCGIAAAVGASCGILSVLGGNEQQMNYAIKNMVANVTGMVCDGAKSGCAVKVATAVSAAVQCAVLAINNAHVPSIDGIVDSDVEQTIRNLGSIGRDGMAQTDQVILDMMTSKAL